MEIATDVSLTTTESPSLFDRVKDWTQSKLAVITLMGPIALFSGACSNENNPEVEKPIFSTLEIEQGTGEIPAELVDSKMASLKSARSDFEKGVTAIEEVLKGVNEEGPKWFDSHATELTKVKEALQSSERMARNCQNDTNFKYVFDRLSSIASGLQETHSSIATPEAIKLHWPEQLPAGFIGKPGWEVASKTGESMRQFIGALDWDVRALTLGIEFKAVQDLRLTVQEGRIELDGFIPQVELEGAKWFDTRPEQHARLEKELDECSMALTKFSDVQSLAPLVPKIEGARVQLDSLRIAIDSPEVAKTLFVKGRDGTIPGLATAKETQARFLDLEKELGKEVARITGPTSNTEAPAVAGTGSGHHGHSSFIYYRPFYYGGSYYTPSFSGGLVHEPTPRAISAPHITTGGSHAITTPRGGFGGGAHFSPGT